MTGVRLLPAHSTMIESTPAPVPTDGDIGGTAPLYVTDAERPIAIVVG